MTGRIPRGNDDKTGSKNSVFESPNVAEEGRGRENTNGEGATDMKEEKLR